MECTFSFFCTVIGNDACHRSGQNLLWSYSTGPCESTTFWPLWWGTQAVIKFVMQTANSFPNNTCSCPKGCTMNCWRKIQTQKYQPYCFNQIRTDLNNYKAGFIKFQAIVHILMRFQSPFAKILGAQAGKLSSKFKQRWNFQSDGTTRYPQDFKWNMGWGGAKGDEDVVNSIQLLQPYWGHFPFDQTFWNYWKRGKCRYFVLKFLENLKIVQFQNMNHSTKKF